MTTQSKKIIYSINKMNDLFDFNDIFWSDKKKIYAFEIEDASGDQILNVEENYAMAAIILNEMEINLKKQKNVSKHLISLEKVTEIVACFKNISELKKLATRKHHNLRKFRAAKRNRTPLTVTFIKVKQN